MQLAQAYRHTNFLFEYMNFLKIIHKKRLFCNESLSNLEDVLQRNLKTDRARECIFRVPRGTSFHKFLCLVPTMVAHSWVRCVYHLAKKNLWIRHWLLSKMIVINKCFYHKLKIIDHIKTLVKSRKTKIILK